MPVYIYLKNAHKWKNWPQNTDLRFPIHKIDKTEKAPPNSDLNFLQT